MVECSPALQKLQYQNLKCVTEEGADVNAEKRCISTFAGIPVSWHATLEQVPTGCKDLCFKLHTLFLSPLNVEGSE